MGTSFFEKAIWHEAGHTTGLLAKGAIVEKVVVTPEGDGHNFFRNDLTPENYYIGHSAGAVAEEIFQGINNNIAQDTGEDLDQRCKYRTIALLIAHENQARAIAKALKEMRELSGEEV